MIFDRRPVCSTLLLLTHPPLLLLLLTIVELSPAPAPSLAAAVASGLFRELTSTSPATGSLVETAAAQVVRRIVNTPPSTSNDNTNRSSSNRHPQPPPHPPPPSSFSASSPTSPPPLFRLESVNFLDKSLEAITGVGRFVEGFAVTLDNVIGQAIEDWGTPTRAKAHQASEIGVDNYNNKNGHQQQVDNISRRDGTSPPSSKQLAAIDDWGNDDDGWGDFGIDDEYEKEEDSSSSMVQQKKKEEQQKSRRSNHTITPFMSRLESVSTDGSSNDKEKNEWERKALAMQAELAQLKKQQEDYKRLKEEHDSIKAQLATSFSNAESNGDSLETAQLTAQMEALLMEKTRLAQENDRLAREKAGLQELLEFTVAHHAQDLGDDELFGDDDDEREEELELEEFSSKLQLE